MPVLVESIEHLKELAKVEGGEEFYITLNFGLKSNKRVEWDPPSQSFCIINEIDDTHQDLTEAELSTKSNIAEAIKNHAFYKS